MSVWARQTKAGGRERMRGHRQAHADAAAELSLLACADAAAINDPERREGVQSVRESDSAVAVAKSALPPLHLSFT